jgi:hypothetical protein
MPLVPPLPTRIADVAVPQDDVSDATWRWAHRSLPGYLLAHSVRSYCWGATIAKEEGWSFDRRILWTASLMHDLGLTRIPRNTMCFEVEGAEIARRFLERRGLPPDDADRVAIAIILHMQASVTLDNGVESVLLDRATGIDVRGHGYETIARVQVDVVQAFPRGPFDRLFLKAIEREVAVRSTARAPACFIRPASRTGWRARRGQPETDRPLRAGEGPWRLRRGEANPREPNVADPRGRPSGRESGCTRPAGLRSGRCRPSPA